MKEGTLMSDTDTLLVFPTDFPIKIMGASRPAQDGGDEFARSMIAIVQRHAPDFRADTAEIRASSNSTYLAVTCVVRATSKAQLDAIYREISAHPWVKMAL
jgi:putative lipoic acid-binding regulatory protein